MASLTDTDSKLQNMDINNSSITNVNHLKLSNLKLEANTAKNEISTDIESLIETLRAKKDQLLNDIDDIVTNTEEQVNKNEVQLEKLNMKMTNISLNLDGFSTKSEICDKLESDIVKLNITIPHLKVAWDRKLMHRCKNKPFAILEQYTNSQFELESAPKWSVGRITKYENDFWKPSAVAVNLGKNEIYIADTGRIFVFSQFGEFLRLLKHRKMATYMSNLASDGGDLLFASSNSIISLHRLIVINVITGNILYNPIIPVIPYGLVFHNNIVYVSNAANDCTHILQLNSKLVQQNKFLLELPSTFTPSMFNYICLMDFAITTNNELYGLFKCNESQVQIFDLEGHIKRYFSIDNYQHSIGRIGSILSNELDSNIFITLPNDSHHILVFSIEGKLIGQIGGKGEKPGCIHKPTSIALSAYGEVIVIDCKNEFNLQLF